MKTGTRRVIAAVVCASLLLLAGCGPQTDAQRGVQPAPRPAPQPERPKLPSEMYSEDEYVARARQFLKSATNNKGHQVFAERDLMDAKFRYVDPETKTIVFEQPDGLWVLFNFDYRLLGMFKGKYVTWGFMTYVFMANLGESEIKLPKDCYTINGLPATAEEMLILGKGELDFTDGMAVSGPEVPEGNGLTGFTVSPQGTPGKLKWSLPADRAQASEPAVPKSSRTPDAYLDEIVRSYAWLMVEAINTNDFSVVEPVLWPGSKLYNAQKKLVADLSRQGIKEELVGCEVMDIRDGAAQGEFKVYAKETVKIIYPKETRQREFLWVYTVIMTKDNMGISDIAEWKQ